MKRISILSVMLLLVASISAQMQSPQINFVSTEHDFGEILEADGPVTHVFKFNNLGSKPLLLKNVKPSCGCTTPKWSKQPILPNGEGQIEVTFNPRNRPGTFRKSITITNNSPTPTIYLVIKGKVLPREKSLEEKYPFPLGGIRAKKTNLSFFNITNITTKTSVVQVLNNTDAPAEVTFPELPDHITAQPVTLEAKKEGSISFTYDASKKKDWGFVTDDVYPWINGARSSRPLKLNATITEDFSKLTPKDREKAPKLQISMKKVDFGAVTRGDVITEKVIISNSGQSPLKIHAVKSASSIVKCTLDKEKIPAGESATIEVTVETQKTKGRQYKTVNIISNDPSAPNATITLTGTVN